jgi:predicted transcriptional regulator YdeE
VTVGNYGINPDFERNEMAHYSGTKVKDDKMTDHMISWIETPEQLYFRLSVSRSWCIAAAEAIAAGHLFYWIEKRRPSTVQEHYWSK